MRFVYCCEDLRVEGDTSKRVMVTGYAGGVREEPQVLDLTFDEASVLRALLTQALFLRQDERERDSG